MYLMQRCKWCRTSVIPVFQPTQLSFSRPAARLRDCWLYLHPFVHLCALVFNKGIKRCIVSASHTGRQAKTTVQYFFLLFNGHIIQIVRCTVMDCLTMHVISACFVFAGLSSIKRLLSVMLKLSLHNALISVSNWTHETLQRKKKKNPI